MSAADAAWNLLRSGAGHHEEAAEIALGLVGDPTASPDDVAKAGTLLLAMRRYPDAVVARDRALEGGAAPIAARVPRPVVPPRRRRRRPRRTPRARDPPRRRARPAAPRPAGHGVRPRRADAGLALGRPGRLRRARAGHADRARGLPPRAGREHRPARPAAVRRRRLRQRDRGTAAALDGPAAAWFDALVLEPVPTTVVERVLIERDVAIPLRDGDGAAGRRLAPRRRRPLPDDPPAHCRTTRRTRSSRRTSTGSSRCAPSRRGYDLVMQDCRGRYTSDGEFEPFVDEAQDGDDTIAWVAAQPCSDGRVGDVRQLVRRRDAAGWRPRPAAGASRDRAAPHRRPSTTRAGSTRAARSSWASR